MRQTIQILLNSYGIDFETKGNDIEISEFTSVETDGKRLQRISVNEKEVLLTYVTDMDNEYFHPFVRGRALTVLSKILRHNKERIELRNILGEAEF
jgi:hypothetical protein